MLFQENCRDILNKVIRIMHMRKVWALKNDTFFRRALVQKTMIGDFEQSSAFVKKILDFPARNIAKFKRFYS